MAAGDDWEVDIVFHTLILIGKAVPSIWSGWSSEILLGLSFVMQLVLTILAGFRWRGPSPGWEQWDPAIRRAIWLCYVGGEYVATSAVGSLSVRSTSGDRQLLAFWAPFFLLHLGGPDNITAYELEDNELSARSLVAFALRVTGALYVVYRSISSRWTLAAAAWLMLGIGVTKYYERILALQRADLKTIRRSMKKERRRRHGSVSSSQRYTREMLGGDKRSDESARVLFAHSQFHICKQAIVESVKMDFRGADAQESKRFFDFRAAGSYEVLEVELSLLYDFLYTKAAVMHTWPGYTIRVLSPLATAAAFLLVEFGRKDGLRQADLVITRVLLAATLLLETVSLAKVLGSSWTVSRLYSRPNWGWIQHHLFCTKQRHRSLVRRAIAYLLRFVKVDGHRRWSGRIGQLHLLGEITHHHPERRPGGVRATTLVRRIVEQYLPGGDNAHVLEEDEKELILVRVAYHLLKESFKRSSHGEKGSRLLKNKAASHIKWGQDTLFEAFGRKEKDYNKFRESLGPELHVGILIWHIATDIYLFKSNVAKNDKREAKLQKRLRAIRTLSKYMMFLLVERPYMLPGLVLRDLYEETSKDLDEICSNLRQGLGESSNSNSLWWGRIKSWNGSRTQQLRDDPQEELVSYLYNSEQYYHDQKDSTTTSLLPFAVRLAHDLIEEEEERKAEPMDRPWYERRWGIIHVVLDVWVEMLVYASYRCSGESHAKQLCNGGELTTVVWLAAAHIDLLSKADESLDV